MPSSRADRLSRAVRCLWPAALLAVAPKCALCLVAYLGLGTALGLGGPELCGAPGVPSLPGVAGWLFVVGPAVAAVAVYRRLRGPCRRNCIGRPDGRLFRARSTSAWSHLKN